MNEQITSTDNSLFSLAAELNEQRGLNQKRQRRQRHGQTGPRRRGNSAQARRRRARQERAPVQAQAFDWDEPIDLHYGGSYAAAASLSPESISDQRALESLADDIRAVHVESFEVVEADPAAITPEPVSTHDRAAEPDERQVTIETAPAAPVAPPSASHEEAFDWDGLELGLSSPKGAAPSDAADNFEADLRAILTGQTPPPAAASPTSPATSPPPAPTPAEEPAADPHAIFDKIGQSMAYATSFDLGTVALEQRFDEFDRDLDRQAQKRPTPATPQATAMAVEAPSPPPASTLDEMDLIEDFAIMSEAASADGFDLVNNQPISVQLGKNGDEKGDPSDGEPLADEPVTRRRAADSAPLPPPPVQAEDGEEKGEPTDEEPLWDAPVTRRRAADPEETKARERRGDYKITNVVIPNLFGPIESVVRPFVYENIISPGDGRYERAVEWWRMRKAADEQDAKSKRSLISESTETKSARWRAVDQFLKERVLNPKVTQTVDSGVEIELNNARHRHLDRVPALGECPWEDVDFLFLLSWLAQQDYRQDQVDFLLAARKCKSLDDQVLAMRQYIVPGAPSQVNVDGRLITSAMDAINGEMQQRGLAPADWTPAARQNPLGTTF